MEWNLPEMGRSHHHEQLARGFLLFFLVLGLPLSTTAKTLVVDKRDKGTIQDALKSAVDGDTILIRAGTYREGNLVIAKSLTIIGEGFPVLDGENKYEIFTITADHVSIIGLRLRNTGVGSIYDIAAVRGIESSGLKILNNQLENAFFGIYLANCSRSLVEGNSLISGPQAGRQIGNGIHAWKCDSLIIKKNEVSGHRDGIYFEFVTNSLVADNTSHGNIRYGLHFMFSHHDQYHSNVFHNNGAGVAVMYSQGVTMKGNRFEDNWGPASYGLLLKDIRDSFIERNVFSRNTVAVYMEGTSRCLVSGNVFSQNGWAVKLLANCDENVLSKNSFLGNTFDLSTNGMLVLNKVEYNYWDNYQGYDLDKNGLGDVPYHPVSLYSMVVEKMPSAVMLWRSLLVYVLDRSERVVPSITPEGLKDNYPVMRNYDYRF